MIRRVRPLLVLGLLTAVAGAGSPTGAATVTPPARIVTLAPHLAELVYAAGGESRLAGVTAYTDYPPGAADLPRVGDAFRLDLERIAGVDPDLILAWQEGTPAALIHRLRELGYPVMIVRTRSLEDVAAAIERIGERLGTSARAERAAASFRTALDHAVAGHDRERPVRVFYQVAERPLYTVGGGHFISELIRRCGGRNVFADLDGLASVVSVESVLSRDPEVILAAGNDAQALEWWRQWQSVSAVRAGNLHVLPPDTLARPSPRLVSGAADICAAIDASRQSLAALSVDAGAD